MAYTNQPNVGLDELGNLLPGYRYVTYSNGVGMGTPIKTADAVNTYAPSSFGAQLAGLNNMDFTQSTNPVWQQQAQQVMQRQTPTSVIGGTPPNLSNMYQQPNVNTPQTPNMSQSQGFLPRIDWSRFQGNNRGNRYFGSGGNYQGLQGLY